LDIARGEKVKGFTAETAEVLRKWQDPASLALVQGTPINCLVVSWGADAAQQQALKPLVEKGKQAGLEFVGLIEGEANMPAAVAAAKAAGLSAVAMEGDAPANAGIPVIPWNKAAQVRSTSSFPIGRFRWCVSRASASRVTGRRPHQSALGGFQRSSPADYPGAGARQDRVDRLRSAGAG
jgi:hypothetical protein